MLYILALVVLIADQSIKWLVQTHMTVGEVIPIWPQVVVLEYIRNPGAAWGMLTRAHGLLIVIALLVVAVVVWLERRYRPKRWMAVGLALVLGGALGNLCDRVFAGTVVDYVYLQIINFPIFNLADVSIDAGVLILLWRSFRSDNAVKKQQEAEDVEP
ncbi:lipoprotein signal peptidase [Alicyclobacillus contaminans]|uniref:signal peptidase II n=1 Tax=Alicyclobacillus contaminans TaxID=392016 RepID=UPI00047E7D7B|nr:signal peptidase II [Alicyclobacillus contaminans]GMA49140.1 lipoprotein signal peptidase [Alicyclobacillus contaminans]